MYTNLGVTLQSAVYELKSKQTLQCCVQLPVLNCVGRVVHLSGLPWLPDWWCAFSGEKTCSKIFHSIPAAQNQNEKIGTRKTGALVHSLLIVNLCLQPANLARIEFDQRLSESLIRQLSLHFGVFFFSLFMSSTIGSHTNWTVDLFLFATPSNYFPFSSLSIGGRRGQVEIFRRNWSIVNLLSEKNGAWEPESCEGTFEAWKVQINSIWVGWKSHEDVTLI